MLCIAHTLGLYTSTEYISYQYIWTLLPGRSGSRCVRSAPSVTVLIPLLGLRLRPRSRYQYITEQPGNLLSERKINPSALDHVLCPYKNRCFRFTRSASFLPLHCTLSTTSACVSRRFAFSFLILHSYPAVAIYNYSGI
jgi:hypothetical protein